MSNESSEKVKNTCFVVMGFGKKTDFETGRTLDLDKSYKNMIKPAVEAAGLECIRADEIVHSGTIDVPMFEQLLNAAVVIADISTSNKNALYELGVRHALRPATTIVIAEDGIKLLPFDLSHIVVRRYRHLGEDIGYDAAINFRQEITNAIIKITEASEPDSPVYTFLKLIPPSMVKTIAEAVSKPDEEVQAESAPTGNNPSEMNSTYSMLMQQVDDAQMSENWELAKTLLSAVRQMMKTKTSSEDDSTPRPEDPYIIQRLALMTYKSKQPTEEKALKEASELLATLDPQTSNDPETLGLWGSVHKRLWEFNKDKNSLDEAVRAYERGFFMRNDYYNGINFAYLLNTRAANSTDRAEAIADFIQARRICEEVLGICDNSLEAQQKPDKNIAGKKDMAEYWNTRYWILATKGEAYVGLEKDALAEEVLKAAYSIAPKKWMKEATEEQIGKLKALLEKSPLKYIMTDASQD